MEKIITIHQPESFPWLGYFNKMYSADLYIILDDVQFEKNNWQNRNKMLFLNNKEDYLTIPVKFNFGDKIKDIKIVDNKFKNKILSRIKQDYKKSIGYELVSDLLNSTFNINSDFLIDYNLKFINEIRDLINITTPIEFSSKLNLTSLSTKRLVEICKYFNADKYIAGAGGKSYLDESEFNNIKVIYQNYKCNNYYSIIYNLLIYDKEEVERMIKMHG